MIDSVGVREDDAWSPGWKWLAVAVLAYSACIVAATWPRITTVRTQLPGVSDAVTNLWILRWNKASLLEGSSRYFNPGLQAPVGSPIGLVSPMHFQSLLYLIESSITRNDILCYNALWFGSYVSAGTGVFWLAWYVLRNRACAGLAGLLAMLSAPMMAHGWGHLELIQIGWFPLFLIAWTRMVDRPGRRRLLASVALYLLVAMSASYFTVFAVFPAITYGVWALVRATGAGAMAGGAGSVGGSAGPRRSSRWPGPGWSSSIRGRSGRRSTVSRSPVPRPNSSPLAPHPGATSCRPVTTSSAGSCRSTPTRSPASPGTPASEGPTWAW
jgi:hypothetical protein